MGRARQMLPNGSFFTPKEEAFAEKFAYALEGVLFLLVLAMIFGYCFLIYKLCCMVKKNTELHNGKKTTIAIIITLVLCWPVAIGQVIYIMVKWGDSAERIIIKSSMPTQTSYPKPYKDDYERWKEERLKEQQKKD